MAFDTPIRVLLAEDQTMVLGALAALLRLESDIEVVGSVADGDAAVRFLRDNAVDVVLTDIEMPGKTGIELAQWIQRQELACRVIILTTFARSGYLKRAMNASVRGYLLKDAPSEELASAIRKVHAGGRVVNPELALEAWHDDDPLTDRERQVLRLAGQGKSGADIAQACNLTQGTVRNYLSEAIGKLGASNRVEAHRIARQKGWL